MSLVVKCYAMAVCFFLFNEEKIKDKMRCSMHNKLIINFLYRNFYCFLYLITVDFKEKRKAR